MGHELFKFSRLWVIRPFDLNGPVYRLEVPAYLNNIDLALLLALLPIGVPEIFMVPVKVLGKYRGFHQMGKSFVGGFHSTKQTGVQTRICQINLELCNVLKAFCGSIDPMQYFDQKGRLQILNVFLDCFMICSGFFGHLLIIQDFTRPIGQYIEELLEFQSILYSKQTRQVLHDYLVRDILLYDSFRVFDLVGIQGYFRKSPKIDIIDKMSVEPFNVPAFKKLPWT